MSRRHHAVYATFTLIIIFGSLHFTAPFRLKVHLLLITITTFGLVKKAISGGPFNKIRTYTHGIDINELNSTILLYLLLAFKF